MLFAHGPSRFDNVHRHELKIEESDGQAELQLSKNMKRAKDGITVATSFVHETLANAHLAPIPEDEAADCMAYYYNGLSDLDATNADHLITTEDPADLIDASKSHKTELHTFGALNRVLTHKFIVGWPVVMDKELELGFARTVHGGLHGATDK